MEIATIEFIGSKPNIFDNYAVSFNACDTKEIQTILEFYTSKDCQVSFTALLYNRNKGNAIIIIDDKKYRANIFYSQLYLK